MALVSLDERILEANAALCRMLGYTRDELLKRTVPQVSHPDDAHVEAKPKGDMKDGKAHAFVVEKRYLRGDGTVMTGRLSVSALYDEQARPAYYLGQLEDVTREREAERGRLMHENQFRALFEHAPDALLLLDAYGHIRQANSPAHALWPDLSRAPEAITIAAQMMLEGKHQRVSKALEFVTEVGGQSIRSEARLAPIPMLGGDGVLVAIRDITERHRVEQALGDALDSVSRTLAEREVLLKEVHHRVKNNLQIVSSLLDMQADSSDGPTRLALSDSGNRVRSMALIHQMLYSGHDLSQVDLGEYAQTLVTQLKGALAPGSKLTLDVQRVDVSVEQAIPCGLIMNELVTNALKHGRSPDGHCHLEVHVGWRGDRVFVSVADQGPGLPPDFEQRGRSSLGMQVVRALVRQLGGKLTHSVGPGTCFTLEAPPHG